MANPSWTIEQGTKYFGVKKCMVKKAKELLKNKGLLCEPDQRTRKSISEELRRTLKMFYQNDEYSRMCPGKKEYLSTKIKGRKEHKQKWLLIVNLKELHLEFLKLEQPIGFPKFCQLCQKWSITVDSSSGVHFVSVCEILENFKLMATALPSQVDYKMLLEKMVCDVSNRNCMMRSSENCPGIDKLEKHLKQSFL